MVCEHCAGTGWVCENHPDRPWDKNLRNGCECGAGEPCARCNGAEGEAPDIRALFETIEIAAPEVTLPRGAYVAIWDAPDEAEHYGQCPLCGAWVDRRDLGAVLDHQRPLPHPVADQVQ
jgi:hypothetical protein